MVKQFIFNHYEVNTYLVVDPATRQCAIVDPACQASYEDEQLRKYIADMGLTPSYVLLTHAHVDHIAGLRQVCEFYRLPVAMHADGRKLLRQAEAYGSMMGFAVDNMDDLEFNPLEDNQVLQMGETRIECRFVPGHCPGSMCFVLPECKSVITGDALFHFTSVLADNLILVGVVLCGEVDALHAGFGCCGGSENGRGKQAQHQQQDQQDADCALHACHENFLLLS